MTLVLAGSALASGLPGMDALIQIAKSARPTPFKLPEVFSITYRTADGEVSLRRGADGALVAIQGDQTFRFEAAGENIYRTEQGNKISLDEVKALISFVWGLAEPSEQVESAAIVAIFDADTEIAGRKANRFRETLHQADKDGYSVGSTGAVWYTFDKKTGVCLMKEVGPDENHENAEVVFECVSYTD